MPVGLGGRGGAAVGAGICEAFDVDATGVGGMGRAAAGGGWEGNAGSEGIVGASAKVCKDVAAVVGLDPMELPHVRPEKPLESDSRGKADLDCRSYS